MATKAQKAEAAEALARLHTWIKPGEVIHCILRHVSSSGMTRVISLKLFECKEGRVETGDVGYNVALALGMPYDRQRGGIKIFGGCGMDMGFALVYDLARTMWPNGVPCTGAKCPSNDHSNGEPRKIGVMHNDGGYALTHHWL